MGPPGFVLTAANTALVSGLVKCKPPLAPPAAVASIFGDVVWFERRWYDEVGADIVGAVAVGLVSDSVVIPLVKALLSKLMCGGVPFLVRKAGSQMVN